MGAPKTKHVNTGVVGNYELRRCHNSKGKNLGMFWVNRNNPNERIRKSYGDYELMVNKYGTKAKE